MVVLIVSGSVPFVVSFWPALKFYRNIRGLVYSISSIMFLYGAWDVFAVYRGHWFFNPTGVWRLRIVNLPIEEALFFVVIPYCCILTWEAMQYLFKRSR